MSFELVYTSARKGLLQGATGFCTVAATEDIPRTLRSKLESMSGYPHATVSDPRMTPVNFSHQVIRVQQQLFHVLSRIADAKKDYSNRTNNIAHHLALSGEETEQFPEGPVGLLADGRFWLKAWERGPQHLAADRTPAPKPVTGLGFSTWQSLFGDAGWAGMLGKSREGGVQSVSVIIPDTTVAFSLLAEAQQLVTPADRWKIGFSTYYTRLFTGECHWRFILEGTDEARRLRSRSTGLVLDPQTRRLTLDESCPYTQAARNNTPSAVHADNGARQPASASGAGRSASATQPIPSTGVERPSQRRRRLAAEAARSRPAPAVRPAPRRRRPVQPVAVEPPPPKRGVLMWIVTGVTVIAAAVLVFLVIQRLS